jgi:hypothetical protein
MSTSPISTHLADLLSSNFAFVSSEAGQKQVHRVSGDRSDTGQKGKSLKTHGDVYLGRKK